MRSLGTMAAFAALTLAAAAASLATAAPAREPGLDQLALGDWRDGRATFYGNRGYNGDPYSIDQGHCMYGGIPGPRYIAALSIWEGFGGDWRYTNCGRCFEIKCREGPRYNCRGDRLNASLIVMVTDKCPCNRWCCGDEPHFDLSFWGFGEIGHHGGGVISTLWRPIECPENMGRGGELVLQPQEYEPYCQRDGSKDILAAARERNLTTFSKAIEQTGLASEIEGGGRKFSVLAPTNEAFERAADAFNASVDALLAQPFMKEVMANHIIVEEDDEASSLGDDRGAQLAAFRTRLETEAGALLDVTAAGVPRPESPDSIPEWLLVGGDSVILDVEVACNGELDIINKVIFPFGHFPGRTSCLNLMDVAQKRGLEEFLAAASADGLDELLVSLGRITVLAPTDKALAVIREGRGNATIDARDFVFLGSNRLDNFQEDCGDASLAGVGVAGPSKNVSSCGVAKAIGLCEEPWVARGYCPRSCGLCRPMQELRVGFEMQAINGERDSNVLQATR